MVKNEMPTIYLYKTDFENLTVNDICKKVNGKKFKDSWFSAKPSKYNNKEVFIQYWYYLTEEEIKEKLYDTFDEEVGYSIFMFLKENEKIPKFLGRTYCFINTELKTLEIYGDSRKEEILSFLRRFGRIEKFELKEVNMLPLNLQPKSYLGNEFWYANIEDNAVFIPTHQIFMWKPRFEVRQIIRELVEKYEKD
jgi:hypothetical protein